MNLTSLVQMLSLMENSRIVFPTVTNICCLYLLDTETVSH